MGKPIGEGELNMTALLEKIQNMSLPPHIVRALGLEDNWKENISPEFIEEVARIAMNNEELLKELSKY